MHYFAYGSNMDERQMRQSCPGARLARRAVRLDGYELDFLRFSTRWQAGVADVVPRPQASVFGCAWDLPEPELGALDEREGVAIGAYRRLPVVVVGDGGELAAFTYTVVEKLPAAIAPTREYALLMLEGAARLGLPAGYQAQMRRSLEGLGVAF